MGDSRKGMAWAKDRGLDRAGKKQAGGRQESAEGNGLRKTNGVEVTGVAGSRGVVVRRGKAGQM